MTNGTIENVSDTAFWVAYYRAKESERKDALFRDPYAAKLVGARGKAIADEMGMTSKYTEWSVVSRTLIIDRFIEKSLGEGVDAVLNLGTGLDTRPYRMNLPPTLEWIEADYANIIQHKESFLKSEQPKCRLTRVVVDLANAEARKKFLQSVAPNAKKILVLTEGVIPYLSPEQVTELSRDLSADPRFAYWITEYFDARVYPYLKQALHRQKMRNAPFLFFPEKWNEFFQKLGWEPKETRYSGEIAREFKRMPPMPTWMRFILPFMPKKMKDANVRMAGYMIFQRK